MYIGISTKISQHVIGKCLSKAWTTIGKLLPDISLNAMVAMVFWSPMISLQLFRLRLKPH